jgi:hypothetical protein
VRGTLQKWFKPQPKPSIVLHAENLWTAGPCAGLQRSESKYTGKQDVIAPTNWFVGWLTDWQLTVSWYGFKGFIFWHKSLCSSLKFVKEYVASKIRVLLAGFLPVCYSFLKVKATSSSETYTDFLRLTSHYIPEDRTLYNHRCKDLQSCMVQIVPFSKFPWFLRTNMYCLHPKGKKCVSLMINQKKMKEYSTPEKYLHKVYPNILI